MSTAIWSIWAATRLLKTWTLLPWRAPAQLTALWLLATTSLALVAGTRARALESLFGGLDAAIRLHRRLGAAALGLLGIHVALLLPPRWPDEHGEVLNPLRPDGPFVMDIVLTAAVAVLAAALPWRRIPHGTWLWIHRGIAGLLLFGCAHALTLSETVRAYEPLRSWMIALVVTGAAALAYRLLLFRHLGPRHGYVVQAVEPRGAGVTDLVLRPAERRITFDPGAFVYLSIRGSAALSAEMHPFSPVSSPTERDLRLSVPPSETGPRGWRRSSRARSSTSSARSAASPRTSSRPTGGWS
jgi:predicted ferric reductase